MILVDIYVFFAIRSLFADSPKARTIYTIVYCSLSALTIIVLLLLPYFLFNQSVFLRSLLFALIFALFIAKLIAALFFMIDDVRRVLQWIADKLFSFTHSETKFDTDGTGISRSVFLTWLGVIAGGSLFSTFVYGLGNKYNYQIKRIKLAFENLPKEFKGLKIVQISDIHSGSFTNKNAVNKGIDKILHENPDMILFTGDLVNNRATEMTQEYIEIFSRLKAPMGVYSILGNHDYGDYFHWNNDAEKEANLEKLKSIHKEMGWHLLLDEHLPLQKNNAVIGLIGVQNISGRGNFHSYGNLSKAMQGAAQYLFKILMSHDPSHWDREVIRDYKDIDLTLSGHTHGMQFGVEMPGFKWSPVQYMYKRWAGLYEEGKQKLYINRGFGFIGYPGRVGILPEITVIEFV
jgi:predicted MPP superfamily phosphohydrolase